MVSCLILNSFPAALSIFSNICALLLEIPGVNKHVIGRLSQKRIETHMEHI
jgi:hypothetical protein